MDIRVWIRESGHMRLRRRLRELGAIECCEVVSMRAEKFFLSSSLCVGDRTLYCSFDLWRFVLYEPVAPPMYQYFAIVISSTVLGSSFEEIS